MHGEHGGFNWISFIPFLNHLPIHVSTAIFVAGSIMLFTWIAALQLKQARATSSGALIPDAKLTYRNFFEIIAESLYKMTANILGEHEAPKYFPIVGTIFVFVFISNFIGLIPGFLPPTDNMNTTLALGVFSFLYYNYVGLRENGLGYLKHFLGPVLWLAPLMLVLEIISHLIRPMSLALRLRGNIMGDHMVLSIFSELVPYGVPIVFLALGLFVCFVQAFVFSLMTMVYVSLSTSHDH